MTIQETSQHNLTELNSAELENLNGGLLIGIGFTWTAILASAADNWAVIKQAAVDGWNYDYNPPK